MVDAGFTNVSRFMYGSTPSGNELSINGQKFKVLSAENSGNPQWYFGGEDGGGSSMPGALRGGAPFTPYQAPEPFSFGAFQGPAPFAAPDKDAVLNDPGHQVRLAEGQRALDASAASKGTLRTGAQGKALERFGQDLGTQDYQDVWNRDFASYQQQFSQALQSYNANRENAYGNYALNLATGQWEWQQNNQGSFNQYQQNYTEGQDNIDNLFKYWQGSQPNTAEPPPVPALPTNPTPPPASPWVPPDTEQRPNPTKPNKPVPTLSSIFSSPQRGYGYA